MCMLHSIGHTRSFQISSSMGQELQELTEKRALNHLLSVEKLAIRVLFIGVTRLLRSCCIIVCRESCADATHTESGYVILYVLVNYIYREAFSGCSS